MNTTTRRRVGLGLTGAVAVFLLADAAVHIANIDVVRTSMAELGYSAGLAPTLGVIVHDITRNKRRAATAVRTGTEIPA
jgi:hypothetical protein